MLRKTAKQDPVLALYPIKDIELRLIGPGRVTDDGAMMLAWGSCSVGPLWLNNMMLVSDNGRIEVRWPQMRSRGFHWWLPDETIATAITAAVLERFLRMLDDEPKQNKGERR